MLNNRFMHSGSRLKNYGTSFGKGSSSFDARPAAAATKCNKTAVAESLGGQQRSLENPSATYSAEMQIVSASNLAFSVEPHFLRKR